VKIPPTKFILVVIVLFSICTPCPSAIPIAQELSRARLIEAGRAGGDYLVRMQRADGSFSYYYDAATDRFEPRRYNIVRHAGSAVSLFDLYAATKDARYLESARRAVRFLTRRLRRARAANASYVLDYDGKAKLGANGLALIAITRQVQFGGGPSDRAIAMRLANLVLAMQRKDGSFETHYKVSNLEAANGESLYYPGEAMLGLLCLFKITGDKRLFEAARRGADFLIDKQQRMDVLPADAWLMQALEVLYDVGHDARYAQHAIALAEAMIADQYTGDDGPGYDGGFGPGAPRATPAASRAEGLLAAYRLALSTGDARAAKIANALKACARFQLSQQLTVQTEGVRNPRIAAGGFRESMTSMKVRIDYVQHNISSLLGIAQTLF
jgi:uncharacterized protein YyaL (SSP411 family)